MSRDRGSTAGPRRARAPRMRDPESDRSGCRTRGSTPRRRWSESRRLPMRRPQSERVRRFSATLAPVRRGPSRSTRAASCRRRARMATSRRGAASPARAGRGRRRRRRCGRRETAGALDAPSPRPRTTPSAADIPRGRLHGRSDERACSQESDRGRDPSIARATKARTRQFRVTCAETASHRPLRRAQTSV